MDPNSYFGHQQHYVGFIGSLCVYNDFVVALPPLWKRVEIESGQTLIHETKRGWFLESKKENSLGREAIHSSRYHSSNFHND